MAVDLQLISAMQAVERRLEKLEAWPQRRLITDYWWTRGWKDDFFGISLAPQYEPRTEAAARSSIYLVDGAHGGVVRLQTGNVATDYARLMLGEQTDLYDSMDPDLGFWLIGYWKLSNTTNILGDMFVNAPLWNYIHIVADTAHGGNWYLRSDNNSGAPGGFWADSGVAIDTQWHVHGLRATSGKAEHWLDGVLINESTDHIPTDPMTPDIRCLARANLARSMDLDWWAGIPG